jgi:thiamine phosphate synthase YjbQ (UPF0047 family)
MPPLELSLEVVPQARIEVTDVRARAAAEHGNVLDRFAHCLYYSFHTTAGYLPQSLAARLSATNPQGVRPYVDLFRTLFPEGAGYRHDDLDQRVELTPEQRPTEPANGDSHLAFIASGLDACVSYVNGRQGPVCFIDLDGTYEGTPRRRKTTIIGYNREIEVATMRIEVPVSAHPIDAINLKDPQTGVYDQLSAFIAAHDIPKGRLQVQLAPGEQRANLTVNEYESLLMRHDLADVLRNPLRFATEKARNMISDPASVPFKTIEYARYDLVRALNRLVDVIGLGESRIERLMAGAMAVPVSRFLRMRRSVSLLVSDTPAAGHPAIITGTYQSPILVQWARAPKGMRVLDVRLTRFE